MFRAFGFALLLAILPIAAQAAPEIGKPAPGFTLSDAQGAPHSLADYKGKIVVLEWSNPQCPYVRKHYDSNTMQKLQKDAVDQYGAVWLRINSSAPGKEGHLDPEAARQQILKDKSGETALLLDPDGKIGHLYEAKTTPHMFVVDPSGTLAYMGAVDDAPSADPATLVNAKSHVRAALDDIRANRPVATPITKPYGCGVKYAD